MPFPVSRFPLDPHISPDCMARFPFPMWSEAGSVPRTEGGRQQGFRLIEAFAGAMLLLGLAGAVPPQARAAEPSPWARSAQSQARLIEGESPPGERLAGLDIRLAPRFITYWRDPGDAGVPPTLTFTGSTNLKSATVLYPVPRKLDEAGALAFGYEAEVTFPIRVVPVDPARPVGLVLGLDYAVCHEICLPAHADLRLDLDGRPSGEAAQVGVALAAVPRVSSLGAAGIPSIVGIVPRNDGGFAVTATGANVASVLFVEAPEGFAYEAGPGQATDAGTMFPVKRLDHPKEVEQPGSPVILTLSTAAGAIEVPIRLDGAVAKP